MSKMILMEIKRALTLIEPMLLYEASNTEEPGAGKPHAGIRERAAGKPVILSRCTKERIGDNAWQTS
jgi:hypothetical protein